MASKVQPNSLVAKALAELDKTPKVNASSEDQATSTVAQVKLSTISEERTAGPMKATKGKAKKAKNEPVAEPPKARPKATSKDLFGDNFSVEDLFPHTVTPEKGPLTKTSEKVAVTVAIAGSKVEIVKPKQRQVGIEYAPVQQPKVEKAPIQKVETVENTNKMRKRLFILGLILLIGGVVGVSLMTNFKFDQIKLKDWHWDVLTAASAVGIVLVTYAIFKRCKKVMVNKEPEIDPRRVKESQYLGWDKLHNGGHLDMTGKGAKNPLPKPQDKLLPTGQGVNSGKTA